MKKYAIEIVVAVVVGLAIVAGIWSMNRAPASDPNYAIPKPIDRPLTSGPDMPSEPIYDYPEDGGKAPHIIATKSYQNGVYTLKGVKSLPTPCHELNIEHRILESYPEQVVVDFTVVDTGAICVQVIDERPWEVQVRVSPEATFRATINGHPTVFDFDEYAK